MTEYSVVVENEFQQVRKDNGDIGGEFDIGGIKGMTAECMINPTTGTVHLFDKMVDNRGNVYE